VDAFARKLVEDAYDLRVPKIVLGDLSNIRLNNREHGRQTNAVVHNFWSHKHLADRIRYTAEEYGIAVEKVSEAYSSTTCPRCRSRSNERRGRLFRCLRCGLESHRDAVGVTNMASLRGEIAVRVMAHPLLLRWDGCGWKPSRVMTTQEGDQMRSKNLLHSSGECQRFSQRQ